MLTRHMRVRTLLMLLVLGSPLGLLGIAPTVAADDCGPEGCIENCRAGVATRSAYAFCDVGHEPRGADTCDLLQGPCGNTVIVCSVDDIRCDVYQQPAPQVQHCEWVWHGPDRGACVDTARADCKLWYFDHSGERCLVPIPMA